ncbi:MAG: hypothetical protein KatS3mg110_2398 [Pirellulaceae bacterium]|nr:MAG: hypothetical protein KatS3mg110_2398 [Pirellulaceae bacterium]
MRTVFALLVAGIVAAVGLASSSSAQQAESRSLFNGKDLSGWKGDTRYWSVQDGAITGKTTSEQPLRYNTFLVWEGGEVKNFELRLKYRIVNGNSGIQYRSELLDPERFIVGGYQADIDSSPRYSGIVYEERGRGILAERGQAVRINPDGSKDVIGTLGDRDALQAKIRNEDWNDYRIVAQGNHLRQYINGVLMSELIDEQQDKAAAAGILALQLHQGPPMVVQFKEIQLIELPE